MATMHDERPPAGPRELEQHFEDQPEGPISAAIIAGGIGAFALGLLTTLAEANETVKGWLELSKRVGQLSGKTVFAVVIWLLAWAVLHARMRRTHYETRRAFAIAMVLVVLGVIGTFPLFFQLFAPD
jgi:hypothetical protein